MIKSEQDLLRHRYYYVDAIKRVMKQKRLSEPDLRAIAERLTNRKDRVAELLRFVCWAESASLALTHAVSSGCRPKKSVEPTAAPLFHSGVAGDSRVLRAPDRPFRAVAYLWCQPANLRRSPFASKRH